LQLSRFLHNTVYGRDVYHLTTSCGNRSNFCQNLSTVDLFDHFVGMVEPEIDSI